MYIVSESESVTRCLWHVAVCGMVFINDIDWVLRHTMRDIAFHCQIMASSHMLCYWAEIADEMCAHLP